MLCGPAAEPMQVTDTRSTGHGLGPIHTVVHLAFLAFFGGIAALLVFTAPSLNATLGTKVLVVVLAVAGVVASISTMMWTRYRQHVRLDGSIWQFVLGPAPDSGNALLAWRWGRRFCAAWIIMVVCVGGTVVVEMLAERWL